MTWFLSSQVTWNQVQGLTSVGSQLCRTLVGSLSLVLSVWRASPDPKIAPKIIRKKKFKIIKKNNEKDNYSYLLSLWRWIEIQWIERGGRRRREKEKKKPLQKEKRTKGGSFAERQWRKKNILKLRALQGGIHIWVKLGTFFWEVEESAVKKEFLGWEWEWRVGLVWAWVGVGAQPALATRVVRSWSYY